MSGDETLERDLRAMLAARDPGPAPASLSIRIAAERAGDRARIPLSAARRLAGMGAVVAAAAAVLALAVFAMRPIASGPGQAVTDPSLPYLLREGDGVATGSDVPVVQLAGAIVALAVLVRLAVVAATRRLRFVVCAGMLAIVLVAVGLGPSNAIEAGVAPVDGAGVFAIDPGRPDPSDPERFFVNVTGDAPFTLFLTVTNSSRLPLEVEGLAAPPRLEPGMVRPVRFVAVGIIADTSVDLASAPRLAFRPLTLDPGAGVALAVLGFAGQCAIAPTDPSTAGSTWIDHVGIVYEQLTIRHTASLALPAPVYVSEPDRCP